MLGKNGKSRYKLVQESRFLPSEKNTMSQGDPLLDAYTVLTQNLTDRQ
jgi:hypothetical protein